MDGTVERERKGRGFPAAGAGEREHSPGCVPPPGRRLPAAAPRAGRPPEREREMMEREGERRLRGRETTLQFWTAFFLTSTQLHERHEGHRHAPGARMSEGGFCVAQGRVPRTHAERPSAAGVLVASTPSRARHGLSTPRHPFTSTHIANRTHSLQYPGSSRGSLHPPPLPPALGRRARRAALVAVARRSRRPCWPRPRRSGPSRCPDGAGRPGAGYFGGWR